MRQHCLQVKQLRYVICRPFPRALVVVAALRVAGRPPNAYDISLVPKIQICTKRGPLGACLKTITRTDANDNDVAKRYFRDPSDLIKQKEAAMRENDDDGNALIQKLRQQSADNQEKNDLYVARKTFEADQVSLAICVTEWSDVVYRPYF